MDHRRAAAAQVAIGWAIRDPVGAANWASSLTDLEARAAATGSVVQIWVMRDLVAAQAWVLSRPAGTVRDRALIAVVGMAAQSGTPDDGLLAGFSEERARLSAITSTGMTIARRDPDAARAYIESHVADPNRREQVLSMLAQAQAAVGIVTDPVTGVRIPVSALGPPVMTGQGVVVGTTGVPTLIGGGMQGEMIGRQQRLFAPPPADSNFEISPLRSNGRVDQNPPH
jgi:hypothetical protein